MWKSKTLCRWHQSSWCNPRSPWQLLVCCRLFSSVRRARNVVKSCTWSSSTRISSGYLCGHLPISFLEIRNLDWNLRWWFATMYRPRPTFVHTFDQSHRILECATRKSICQVSLKITQNSLTLLSNTVYLSNYRLHGCYAVLDSGNLSDALVDFTSGVSEVIDLKSISSQLRADIDAKKGFFTQIQRELEDHSLMCCAIQVPK